MKKFLFSVALLIAGLSITQAQNLLSKVPSAASVVIKYAGENFSKNVPLTKMDTYGFIKNNFFKLLPIDTLTSLQSMGINFEEDTYQYISMEDTAMSFVTLMHLKNKAQFLQLIKGTYKTGTATNTVEKEGFTFLAVSAETYIGWNETLAIIVNTTYQNKKSYYDHLYNTDVVTALADSTVLTATDAPMAVDTVIFTPPKIVKDKKPTVKKAPAKGAATTKTKTATKKPPVKMKVLSEDALADYKYHIQDSINNIKRELWDQQQDMVAKKKQQDVAENIMAAAFTGTVKSIANELSYKKIIEPAAHASVWFNAESLTRQYWNYFYRGIYGSFGSSNNYLKDTANGFKSAVNIYFEKDKMRMEQKTFSTDTQLAAMGKAVMNSKQNESLVKYVNPGNIGYLSTSINTEAMANYYYTVLKKYLNSTPYISDYADIANLYIDLLEIVIDEKGIADLMPGNFLFVLHDMKPRIVNYTDYDYDKDFNKTEVKKTKKELSPDFTFVIETKKEGFMQKLAQLPLKYAVKENYNYKDKSGYYELAFAEGKFPISSLYFMVKDGKAIITTSKEVIDMTFSNTGYATDADAKNAILNNNYSLKLNTKRLIERLSTEFSTDLNKQISEYASQNIGDIKMESSLKDGMIQGTTTLNIAGKHSNSLEFFFNMIDAINNIIEKDKQEKEKKIN